MASSSISTVGALGVSLRPPPGFGVAYKFLKRKSTRQKKGGKFQLNKTNINFIERKLILFILTNDTNDTNPVFTVLLSHSKKKKNHVKLRIFIVKQLL